MTAELNMHLNNPINFANIIKERMMNSNLPALKTKTFQKNESIYLPLNRTNHIFAVKEGRVKIGSSGDEDREVIKRVVATGEIFGALSFIGQDTPNDYAIAMEATEVYLLTKEEMLTLIPDQNRLSQLMIQLLGARLIDMEARVESMVFQTSRIRVIDFLDKLVARRGQRVGYEMLVRKFFTHQEIANLTATSRQTVTTVLNELKGKNILIFNRSRLLIRDMDLLRAEVA